MPDSLKGFSGVLIGNVLPKDQLGFWLKINGIGEIWNNNEADHPKTAIGKTVLINAQWQRGAENHWHPVPSHVRFIANLELGEKIAIEVINDEGERLHILELSEKQREREEETEEGRGKDEGDPEDEEEQVDK